MSQVRDRVFIIIIIIVVVVIIVTIIIRNERERHFRARCIGILRARF